MLMLRTVHPHNLQHGHNRTGYLNSVLHAREDRRMRQRSGFSRRIRRCAHDEGLADEFALGNGCTQGPKHVVETGECEWGAVTAGIHELSKNG